MLRYLVPLLFVITQTSLGEVQKIRRYAQPSAASDSQIKFAIENKYDDTGPGAKEPEHAYYTYKNLEDALIAYLDDPDTKLPDHERAKAINKLVKSPLYLPALPNAGILFQKSGNLRLFDKSPYLPLTSHESDLYIYKPKVPYPEELKTSIYGVKPTDVKKFEHIHNEKKVEPFKFQRLHSVKGSPLSLAHYTRDHDQKPAFGQFDSHPKYSFSYGVHDKKTGDSKTVQESRDGGTVHGYYSYIDADGKTHTVHYTADDQHGFRANVKKT